MRRILSSAGWYLAGLLTLPLLYVGTRVMIATAADHHGSVVIRDADEVEVVFESDEEPAISAERFIAKPVSAVVEESIELPDVALEPEAPEFAQADAELKINAVEDLDPFSSDATIRRRELGFDEPPAPPKAPLIVLPVTTESLASDAALDEGALAKVKELRETLKKVVEEKAAKLSAAALEAEIQMHQRHLADLNALQELVTLANHLKELSDKYPNSESGKQAGEMLKFLERMRRSPAGTKVDVEFRQTRFAPSIDAFDSAQNPENYREQPIQPRRTPEGQ